MSRLLLIPSLPALRAGTEIAKILEGVDAGAVAVLPGRLESVTADRLEIRDDGTGVGDLTR